MEKTNVPYGEWPEWVKIFSAAYIKSLIVKTPKKVRQLSYVSFFIGILLLIQQYSYWNDESAYRRNFNPAFPLILLGLLNVLLGFLNYFVTYKLYAWVYGNSSWEERFAHRSSGKHKFQYFLVFVGLILISWLIAHLICY